MIEDKFEFIDWPELYEQAKAALRKKQGYEAEERYVELIKRRPNWLGARMGLLHATLLKRDFSVAYEIYRQAVGLIHETGQDPSTKVRMISRLLDVIFNSEGGPQKTPSLIEFLNQCVGDIILDFKDLKTSAYYEGALLHCKGQKEKAAEAFQFAALLPGPEPTDHSSGFRTMRDTHFLSRIKNIDILPKIEGVEKFGSVNPDGKHVIFCGCDSIYFARFAENFIDAISAYELNVPIHFHVTNPTEETFKIVEQQAKLPGVEIHLSTSSFTGKNWKTYFACERFFLLPSVLNYHQKNIILVDVDSCFIKNPWAILSSYDPAALIIKGCGDKANQLHLPWRTVNAGFIRVPNSPLGCAFARLQGNYIYSLFEVNASPEKYWYMDQSALYVVTAYMKSNGDNILDIGTKTSAFCIFPDFRSGSKDDFVEKMQQARDAERASQKSLSGKGKKRE